MMGTYGAPKFVVSRAAQPALAMRLAPQLNGLGACACQNKGMGAFEMTTGPNAFWKGLGLGVAAVGITWFSFHMTQR